MLESLDGKINSGNTDELDADKDQCKIEGVKEGLQQYYDIECTTDYFSLNTGRVMAKIGVNDRKEYHNKVEVIFVIIDNKPHLNKNGIDYICNWVEKLILVTTNKVILFFINGVVVYTITPFIIYFDCSLPSSTCNNLFLF